MFIKLYWLSYHIALDAIRILRDSWHPESGIWCPPSSEGILFPSSNYWPISSSVLELSSEQHPTQPFSCPVQFPTVLVFSPPSYRIPWPFQPACPHASVQDGILSNLSVNPFLHFSTEQHPSEAFLVFGSAAGTMSTDPLPPILSKATAACTACWIAVIDQSLSPPSQGSSPNALNECQVCPFQLLNCLLIY